MDIVLRGLFYGYSGFAHLNRGILKGLQQCDRVDKIYLDIRHYPENVGYDGGMKLNEFPPLPVDTSKMVLIDSRLAHNYHIEDRQFALRIGYSILETDRISIGWMIRCNQMDAMVTSSAFNKETYTRSGVVVPMQNIFPGVFEYEYDKKKVDKQLRDVMLKSVDKKYLSPKTFKFLMIGQWSPSSGSRKNWEGLIKAYANAFTSKDDVVLFVKPDTGGNTEAIVESELIKAGNKDAAPIITLDGNWDREVVESLFDLVDCYVLPTHGEGLGLDLITAMVHKIPIITTKYGASVDYLPDGCVNWIIPDGFEKVPPEIEYNSLGAIESNHQWARVDDDKISKCMREVYDDRKNIKQRVRKEYEKVTFPTLEEGSEKLVDFIEDVQMVRTDTFAERKDATLFVQPMSLGDIFMISAIISGYHTKFPHEKLYVMTKKKYHWLFDGCPFIEGLLEYPDPIHESFFRCAEHFTTELGFNKIIRPFEKTQLDMHWILSNCFPEGQHIVEHYAEMVGLTPEEIGDPYIPEMRLPVVDMDLTKTNIVIHPCTFDSSKVYDKFGELIDKLQETCDAVIYQVGSIDDELVHKDVVDMRGVDYTEMLYLLKKCSWFIGIDSFFGHLAGAVGCNGVVLFGGTNSSFCAPYWGKLKAIVPERMCGNEYACHGGVCSFGKNSKCINNIEAKDIIKVLGGT